MEAPPDLDTAFDRLAQLKLIRERTLQLEKIKVKIFQQLQLFKEDEQSLGEFQSELNKLEKEKLFYADALKIIEGDILLIKSLSAEATQERNSLLCELQHLTTEYKPLKSNIDILRAALGLDVLEDDFRELDTIQSTKKRPFPATNAVPLDTNSSVEPSGSQEACTERKAGVDEENQNILKAKIKILLKTCHHCKEQIPSKAPSCSHCKTKTMSMRRLRKSRKRAARNYADYRIQPQCSFQEGSDENS